MIQCAHCGTRNRDGSKFCSDCGARLVQQSGMLCPMCGTPNTVENVFCNKCGARLVPLTVAPQAERTPPPAPIKGLSLPAKPAESAPSSGKVEPAKPVEPAAPISKAEPIQPAPPDERKPDDRNASHGDWLARLRAMPPEEEAPSPENAGRPPATQGASSLETIAPVGTPPATSEESSEWVARLSAITPVESALPQAATPQDAPPPEETSPRGVSAPADAPVPSAQELESGDWITQLRPPKHVASEANPSAEPPRATAPHADAVEIAEEDLPDWLRTPPALPTQEPAAGVAGEAPSWMADLRAEQERVQAAAQAVSHAPRELPDWLIAKHPADTQQDTGAPAPAERAAPPPQEPDLLEPVSPAPVMQPPVPTECYAIPTAESATPAESRTELPNWLKDASAPATTEPAAPKSQELGWLKPVTVAPEAPPVPTVEAEIPDWLRALKPEIEKPAAPTDAVPASEAEPQRGEELLESLEVAAFPILPRDVEKPAWLTETPGTEISEEEYLPDWLRTPIAGKGAPAEAELPAAGTPGSEEGEVPDWIAALKPVKRPDIATFESEPLEMSGPLAGLRGVLPLATAVTEPHTPSKPPAPTPFKETAHLFDSILTAPAPAPVAPAARTQPRIWTMRPLIYALMLLAILIPFAIPDIANPSLRIVGTPAENFYETIQALRPNSLVVLAFDYDPGSAGEMDLQANVLVRHLMSKRVKIAAVSTLETGPQIAQRVLENATRRHGAGQYTYGVNYLNLGYLPGQEAGLAQLATAGFAPTARDYEKNQTLDKYPEFANVRNWRNVDLLIELAGSAEPLQKWMEQVQPRAGVKIVAGVSATAEPRARAYRSTRQLGSFISGVVGAAQYEVLSNQRGLAVISAGAQNTALMVLLGVIVVGNLALWVSRGRGKTK